MMLTNVDEELQRAFPNMFGSRGTDGSTRPYSARTRAANGAIGRIRRGMQDPTIQATLEQPNTQQQQQPQGGFSGSSSNSRSHIPRLVSPRMPHACTQSPQALRTPVPCRRPELQCRHRAGRGIGITRLLTAPRQRTSHSTDHAADDDFSGSSTFQSPYGHSIQQHVSPSPSCSHSFQQHLSPSPSCSQSVQQSYQRFTPYQVPQYHRRTSYIPSRRARSTSQRTSAGPRGRWFTKAIVLVDDSDIYVPRGYRRQQLHEMGAVVDLVDFSTTWSEKDVRQAIEAAFGGMIDEDRPPPRYQIIIEHIL